MSKKKEPRYIDVTFYLKGGKKKNFTLPTGYPYFFAKAGLFLVESLVMCKLECVFVQYTYVKNDHPVVDDTEDTYVGRLLQKWEDDILPFD